MAYEGDQVRVPGLSADTDLSGHQFGIVALGTNPGTVTIATAAGTGGFVLQNDPAEGQAAAVCMSGVSKLRAGSAGFNRGDIVTNDASGLGVASAGGGYAVGIALEDTPAGAVGTIAVEFFYVPAP